MPPKKQLLSIRGPLAIREKETKNIDRLRFSGHQTFVARIGWLEKGVGLVCDDPNGFLADDAVVRLGVGKNMVESIKYWCLQTGLIEEVPNGRGMRLAALGKYLFGSETEPGVDPFLEDESSLWLLHYHMVCHAPISTWTMVFNFYNKPEFKKEDLVVFVNGRLSDMEANLSGNTIDRDVDCFIRTYAGTRIKGGEESFDSPFLSLRLIQPTSSPGLFRFNIGRKNGLPDELVAYSILRFMEETDDMTIPLSRLRFDPHSPGQVFKLDEKTLVETVLSLDGTQNGCLRYSDTAGLSVVQCKGDKRSIPEYCQRLLNRHYQIGGRT